MPKRERRTHLNMDPGFPFVERKDFSTLTIKPEDLRNMWEIVGPTVHRMMIGGVGRPPMHEPWKLMTICYIQGLMHGMEAQKDMLHKRVAERTTEQRRTW